MTITRINTYDDPRFSPEALRQHGCYLLDDQACEVRIVAEDVIIPVIAHEGRYISLDGHTRLFLAAQQGWQSVRAVHDTADDVLLAFAEEAAGRGVHTPADMTLLSHAEYEVRWNQFCDDFMARLAQA